MSQAVFDSGLTIYGALLKVDGLFAITTKVFFVEFIGKNFFFRSALRAFTGKRFQMSVAFEARAMLGCGHDFLLLLT